MWEAYVPRNLPHAQLQSRLHYAPKLRHTPGFLKLLLFASLCVCVCVCVCVCMSTPEGINNYSHEMINKFYCFHFLYNDMTLAINIIGRYGQNAS